MSREETMFEAVNAMNYLNMDSGDLDGDSCDMEEIETLFDKTFHLSQEEAISLKKDYILQMAVTDSPNPTIAVGLSDDSCCIYNLSDDGLRKQTSLPKHENTLTEVVFDHNDDNLVYTSSLGGTIKLWDLRDCKTYAVEFKGQEDVKTPILAFDISKGGPFICAGTELVEGDSFLLFWDQRTNTLLGGYWESHTDDITQVKFHPTKPDLLATGSTDGLINVFDISLKSEYDALQYSYNSESSVQTVHWFRDTHNRDSIACVTHTNDLQIWDVEESEMARKFTRQEVAVAMKRNSAEFCYIAGAHQYNDNGELLILGGSNFSKGQCLRSLLYADKDLTPMSIFCENKQIVRCSSYNRKTQTLITAGESGIISVWKPGTIVTSNQTKHKESSAIKISNVLHKSKPY